MEAYRNIYKDFIRDYILNHSPFRMNEQVRVVSFHSENLYQITKIVVDSEGEFNYEITSPRTHSTLPGLFSPKRLSRAD